MNDINRALADIADIHSQIATNRRFRGFGPGIIAVTGALALSLGIAQHVWTDILAASNAQLLLLWVGLAIVCVGLIGTEMLARVRRLHGRLGTGMTANTIERFLPAGAAGAAISGIVLLYAPDTLWIVPGLWQVLLSIALFAMVPALPRATNLVAAWYFLSGIACLLIASKTPTLSPWLLSVPFFIGQCLMAAILYSSTEQTRD